jgi:hypothetical protein
MRFRPETFAAAAALAAALAVAGCDAGAHEHAGHGHDEGEHGDESGHVHVAPHGGTLVVLEEEALHVELVLDPTDGTLTAFLLDGHCENPVRVAQDAIELTVTVGGTAEALRLAAVANELTGETVGDTSQFAGRSDSLRGAGEVPGTLRQVKVGARAFQGVPFRVAPADSVRRGGKGSNG